MLTVGIYRFSEHPDIGSQVQDANRLTPGSAILPGHDPLASVAQSGYARRIQGQCQALLRGGDCPQNNKLGMSTSDR